MNIDVFLQVVTVGLDKNWQRS